jgi:hypothetical protein
LVPPDEIILKAKHRGIEKYQERIPGIDPAISEKRKHDHSFPSLPTNTGISGWSKKRTAPIEMKPFISLSVDDLQ